MVVNSSKTNGTLASLNDGGFMELSLHISDSELCKALSEYEQGRERHGFAISALKIGAIALRQAQGRIDAERVRQEGDRFIENMSHALGKHQNDVTNQINNCLKTYFAPDSGQFNERVRRLVEKDGELELVIRSQIGDNGSELSRTLETHVGKDSQLMQKLDPQASDGLISLLAKSTEDTLSIQRERILSEFSLDNGDGALSRLVGELKKSHGEVGEALENRIEAVTGEFSLDKEDSALSRLVSRVDQAQSQISREFSLDEEGSALARMRGELLNGIEKQREANEKFQGEVIGKLADMTARKQESERSTRHGNVFEDEVFDFINERCQKAGDIAIRTGNTSGRISRSKKGDAVIKLSPDHAAAEAQIVVEAKQSSSYKLDDALKELDVARENRDAGVGIFVFSVRSAPAGIEPFGRYGDNIVIVWDAEDPASDVVFDAGLSVAKALSVRAKAHSDRVGADIDAIERAVSEIQKRVEDFNEITTWSTTIKNNSDRILKSVEKMRDSLNSQVGILNEKVSSIPRTG